MSSKTDDQVGGENNNKAGKNPNQEPKRYPGRRGRFNRSNNAFKGETPGMQGHVFEVLNEQMSKGQFKQTMEALERYAGQTYPKEITLLQPLFKRLEEPKIDPPDPPTNENEGVKDEEGVTPSNTKTSNEWEVLLYTERVKMFLRQEEALKGVMISLFNTVLGQCSPRMKDELRSNKKYEEICKNDDLTGLLNLIKVTSHQFTTNRSLEECLDEATRRIMTYQQGDHESVADHIKNIRNMCEILEHYGGWFIDDQALIEAAKKKG